MAHYDLFTGQKFKFTCLYLLVIQVPTSLTHDVIANLPVAPNPAGLTDIAELTGQAPADGIPISLGVPSNPEHKFQSFRAQHMNNPSSPNDNKLQRRQVNVNFQNNKGGLSTQQSSYNDPTMTDQKFLEQKLKLLQLIDQLGFDEAIRVFQEQIKPEAEWDSEGGQTQPPNPTTYPPPSPKTKHPKIHFAITEPPPIVQITETQPPPPPPPPAPQLPQMDATNVEKYTGYNGTLEQTVSMNIPRNQNIPNPTNLIAPPHHQTNVYIQQTKFHNAHQDISDKSTNQNEQVVVSAPVLTSEYTLNDNKDSSDYDDDNADIMYDEDRKKGNQEEIQEVLSKIGITRRPTQKPTPTSRDLFSKAITPSPQRRTTMVPLRFTQSTTTKNVIPTRKMFPMFPTRTSSKPLTNSKPFDLSVLDNKEGGDTENQPVIVKCPSFLEFVVEAQIFWQSLKQSSGIVNSFELVVQAIVQSMKTLGRCFYRISSDVIQVIIDYFGVRDHTHSNLKYESKRELTGEKFPSLKA